MGNIVFDGLSALSFTKQLDEYGTEVILSMETIRHSVERVLRVYESNGATNDYLEETRKTLWDLQLDYGAFLDDFIATLKNIGDTYENADKRTVEFVSKDDINFSKESVINSINNFIDNNIAKPLTEPLSSVKDSYQNMMDKAKSSKSSKEDISFKDEIASIINNFDKK